MRLPVGGMAGAGGGARPSDRLTGGACPPVAVIAAIGVRAV